MFSGLLPESQGLNLALTVLRVPYLLDKAKPQTLTSKTTKLDYLECFAGHIVINGRANGDKMLKVLSRPSRQCGLVNGIMALINFI